LRYNGTELGTCTEYYTKYYTGYSKTPDYTTAPNASITITLNPTGLTESWAYDYRDINEVDHSRATLPAGYVVY
jgi:hypothetical protein